MPPRPRALAQPHPGVRLRPRHRQARPSPPGLPADPVLRVVRLRTVDDEPIAIERIHLPHALVAGLGPDDMESGNFYQFLRTRFGVDVRSATQSIEPTVTDEIEAELLNVPQHAPALLIERTSPTQAGGSRSSPLDLSRRPLPDHLRAPLRHLVGLSGPCGPSGPAHTRVMGAAVGAAPMTRDRYVFLPLPTAPGARSRRASRCPFSQPASYNSASYNSASYSSAHVRACRSAACL